MARSLSLQTSRLDVEFMLVFERGEHRLDIGPDSVRPNYDVDGNVVPEDEEDG